MKINNINFGDFNVNKLHIKIFDINNNIVINDYIDKITYYDLDNGIYIIKIFINSNLINSYVILHRYNNETYNLYLCNNNSKKIFYLYDYFYKDLKIERGELILGS